MRSGNVLEASRLTVRLDCGGGRALDVVTDVSFTLQAGRCLAIVGESGCGKSVTALSVMGLLPETMYLASGTLRVDGLEVTELTEGEMQKVRGAKAAMIFQEPATSLNPVITVGDQIAEAVLLHRSVTKTEAQRAAGDWLDRVGLGADKAGRFAHELSGGQKQRVMIAMALACEPRVLVADEPTTALDVTLQAQILDLVERLCRETGVALLLITHDLALVRRYADRVALMYAGMVVEMRDTDAFFTAPRHPYAAQLLAAVPSREKAGRELPHIAGSVPSLEAMPEGCRYAPRCAQCAARCLGDVPAVSTDDGGWVRCCEKKPLSLPTAPALTETAGTSSSAVLEVSDLTVEYVRDGGLFKRAQTTRAVDGVSLRLEAGRTLALVGESGSGKTTLAKAVLGLLEPTGVRIGGSIVLNGRAAYDRRGRFDGRLRRFAQIVFQDPFASLDPRMSVGACIEEGLAALEAGMDRRERERRIAELLERVGLAPDAARRLPHEFSGGQRQRIAVARALAVRPQLLVCDEPTSALDVSVQAQVLNLLRDIQRDTGIAMLLITHNFAVVEYAAHRVAVMKDGRLVEAGNARDVLTHPRQDYTRTLLSAVPRL